MSAGICNQIFSIDPNIGGNVPVSQTAAAARSIFFGIDPAVVVPPQEQLDLKRDIERALHTILRLFPDDNQDAFFRPYYIQLLNIAEVGLLGSSAKPDIAKRALEGFTAELIDDEGENVKNAHLLRLAYWAGIFSIPCVLAYTALRLMQKGCPFERLLERILLCLQIKPTVLSCFMMLWVGCFVGVVLSYGVRTTTMTLNDLVTTDADRLRPQQRLLFAGALTMLFGILLLFGLAELKIGTISTREIGENPLLAFLIGAFCGLSELALPGSVSKKATSTLGI